MHWFVRALLTFALLTSVAPSAAFAQRSKLDDHLRRLSASKAASSQKVNVILRMRPERLAGALQRLPHRSKLKASYSLVDAVAVEIRRDQLTALAADPDVDGVSLDAPVASFAVGDFTSIASSTSVTRSDTDSLLRNTLGVTGLAYSGAGIGVAIIDSGIQPLADFEGRITAFRDFTKDDAADGRASAAYDDYGHGTHIAGLIGSNGDLSDGEFRGVAPTVRLIGLKVLDGKGQGTTSDVIAAIGYTIKNKASLGIDIINLSLGHPIYEGIDTDPLVQAVEQATRAGIIVVAAAGNVGQNIRTGAVGYAGIMSPGNAPSAITVGAVQTRGTTDRRDDRVADYSSRGPTWYDGLLKPDVVAPGDSMVSNVSRTALLAREYPQLVRRSAKGGSFLTLSGTSMATGVTSGVVALVLEANRFGGMTRIAQTTPSAMSWSYERWMSRYRALPVLSANLVKAVLQYSALDVSSGQSGYDAMTQGAGAVNAEGAVRLAFAVDVTVPAGKKWMGSFGQTATTIAGRSLPWKKTVYWGAREVVGPSLTVSEQAWLGHVVWGTSTFWSSVADLEHIVWGAGVQWLSFVDEHIVWGTGKAFGTSYLGDEHIVWGSGLAWDEHIVWGSSLIGLSLDEHIVWGSAGDQADTVWGNLYADLEHIVWGTLSVVGLK